MLDPWIAPLLYSQQLAVMIFFPRCRPSMLPSPSMLNVEEALAAILARVNPLPSEPVPLVKAMGRVLAEDIGADIDNPPFDNSAVDGYAVRAVDTEGASSQNSVSLSCLGEVAAGKVAAEELSPGECIRVMTGAPVPAGADAMVMREDAREENGSVYIHAQATAGDHIRRAGNDFRVGDTVLHRGTLIGPAEVAMLAAVGREDVSVYRRPRVAVFSTGDELVDIDTKPGPGQIRDSNRVTLEALVLAAGGDIFSSQRLPDDLAATEHAFSAAAALAGGEGANVIVTSGGVSVGDHDYVKPALEKLGTLELWRIRMKPGKPLAFGSIDDTLFLGLPGNPVSTMVTFELFVRPVLWKLAGRLDLDRPRVEVTLTDGVRHSPGRREYARCVVWQKEGSFRARTTGSQGSGVLTSMLGANGLLVIPEESEGFEAGDAAKAILTDLPLAGPPV